MKDLQKVKEALEFIIERESERIEPLVAAGKFPVEASVRVVATESLLDLNNHIERLESQELVEEVAKVMFVPPISASRKEDVKAAIDIIKGE